MKKRYVVLIIAVVVAIALTVCLAFILGNNRKTENPPSDFEYTAYPEDNIVVITRYIGEATNVVIPKKIDGYKVVGINSFAFMSTDIESVDIPDTVESIENKSFANCQNLHTVNMGNGVVNIEMDAFRKCTKLTTINFSSNLTKLGHDAFAECSSLQNVVIPASVKEWGVEVFWGCPLTSLTFEDGIEVIGNYACFSTPDTLKSVTIPSSVTTIGEHSFNKWLTEVYFTGDAPTQIGKSPFDQNTIIYYNKNSSGWEDTPLRDEYELVARN